MIIENGIRGEICHAVYRYAKRNNKYMENYDEDEESLYLQYVDANNLYGYPMSQNLPVMSKKDEDFIRKYDEDGDITYFLEVDIEYPRELHDLHSNFPFLPKRMRINKCNKPACYLYDKKLCCPCKIAKTSIKPWYKTKTVHKTIAFSKKHG